MNAKTAKKIRKLAYGDGSLRIERDYVIKGKSLVNEPMSRRSLYQGVKKAVKRRGLRAVIRDLAKAE